MKITYTNTPDNKQKSNYPSFKTIALMSCVIAVMVAIKVFYAPEESMKDVAAMANATITEKSETKEEDESSCPEGVHTSTMYVSAVAYTESDHPTFVRPLRGIVTSAFAERTDPFDPSATEFHRGIDIAPEGDALISAYTDGRVVMAGYDRSYGNFIKLDHGNGIETIYAHCSSLLAGEGEYVRAGQIIAVPGDTGDATGVHLHFEIRQNGECIDPEGYLP